MPTQTTDGQDIPAVGTTKQYIADANAGWMYIATTTVLIEQKNLAEFKQHVESVKAQIAELQAEVAAIEPASVDFETAVKAIPVKETVVTAVTESATSTPMN